MRQHRYQQGFKSVAGPSVKMREIKPVLEILYERPIEQWLEGSKMPRGAPELRCGLGAKAEGAFAEVVDKRQKAEPRRLHLLQIDQPAGPSETPADGRLIQERFENARYIRAMIDNAGPPRLSSRNLPQRSPAPGLPCIGNSARRPVSTRAASRRKGCVARRQLSQPMDIFMQRLPGRRVRPTGGMGEIGAL